MRELDLTLPGGGTLHAYDSGPDDAPVVVLWHHGTPNIGTPPAPLAAASQALGIRWISYDRPGYGGSTPAPGRDIASAAELATALTHELGIECLAVMGHSGGGPHALACAALMPDQVFAAVVMAGLAPFDADGLDWFAGMADSGVATLRAAAAGPGQRRWHEATFGDDYDPEFNAADLATLRGPWAWLEAVVGPALAGGPDAAIDDDLAYVAPWGFAVEQVTAPVLVLHGGGDRVVPSPHGSWLAAQVQQGELRLSRGDGHLSVLEGGADALEWIVQQDP